MGMHASICSSSSDSLPVSRQYIYRMEGEPKVQVLLALMSAAGPRSSSSARWWRRLMASMRLYSRKESSSSISPSSLFFWRWDSSLSRMIRSISPLAATSFSFSCRKNRVKASGTMAKGYLALISYGVCSTTSTIMGLVVSSSTSARS